MALALQGSLKELGFRTQREVRIVVEGGATLKPDLVAWKNNTAHIIDVTVCGSLDPARPDAAFAAKMVKYDRNEVKVKVRAKLESNNIRVNNVRVTALVLDLRGFLDEKSAADLKGMGLPGRDFERISRMVVGKGMRIWREFNTRTEVYGYARYRNG